MIDRLSDTRQNYESFLLRLDSFRMTRIYSQNLLKRTRNNLKMAAIATNFGYVFESVIIHQSGRSYFKNQTRLVSIEPNDLTLGGVEGNLLSRHNHKSQESVLPNYLKHIEIGIGFMKSKKYGLVLGIHVLFYCLTGRQKCLLPVTQTAESKNNKKNQSLLRVNGETILTVTFKLR